MIDLEEYLDKLKHKDEEAFSIIYHETKHSVYALILSIIQNKSDAEDIMQDVYLTMIEKINYYKPGSNFRTWLLTISRNKAIDYYRQQKKLVLIDPADDYLFQGISAVGEKKLLIEETLKVLSVEERQIFLLKTISDLKHREIAKIINLPLGTVIWHYNKAVKKINKLKEEK